jgi:hypothetical protein
MMLSLANTLVSARASGGFVGPLDDYTANLAGAWSAARRLLTSYTGSLIRVRRSSDNAEMDIDALASGALDVASMLTFCGAGNGFIRMRYDQLGANNIGQSSAAAQEQIVSSGSLVALVGQPFPAYAGAQYFRHGCADSGAAVNYRDVYSANVGRRFRHLSRHTATGFCLHGGNGSESMELLQWCKCHSFRVRY